MFKPITCSNSLTFDLGPSTRTPGYGTGILWLFGIPGFSRCSVAGSRLDDELDLLSQPAGFIHHKLWWCNS